MKNIFIIIAFILFILLSIPKEMKNQNYTPPAKEKILTFEKPQKTDLYEFSIDYIKFHEGFTNKIINDNGMPAIGYGCRIKFTSYKDLTITKQQADSLLRSSFNQNLKLIKRAYPNLTQPQILAVTHLSYAIGLGNAKRHKFISKNGILRPHTMLKSNTVFSKGKHLEFRKLELAIFNFGN